MPLDTTLLTRNRVFGGKLETTTGTAISLAAADCALFGVIHEPRIVPNIPPNERPGQQYLSMYAPVPGAREGKLTFRSEVFGSGVAATAPAWAIALLPACGFSIASNVYSLFTPTASAPFSTITAGLFQAGRLRQIAGAAGNIKITGNRGDPCFVDWDFTGVWQPPTATAIPSSISYPTTIPPRFANATMTIGATQYRIPSFELDLGNTVHLREDANNIAGYRAAIVVSRRPVLRIKAEALPLGTQDWNAAHLAATPYTFAATIGSVTGNELSIAAPTLQLLNPPQDEDRGGVMTDDLEFLCVGAADSDFTLTFP